MGDDVPILGALVTLYGATGNCCFWWYFYTSVWSDHHISSLYLVWEMTCQFWGLWSHFTGQRVTVDLMIFLYISMVRSSYIIIVSGMGDDVPILGALVTLYGATGNCCFWWYFYTSVWSDHHISSLYLVWEMTCQFWGLWSHFTGQRVTVVFDDISIHQYGQIIIYHHCIWYGRWRPNFGGSGHTLRGNE